MILNRWPKCVLKGEKIMEEILRQEVGVVFSKVLEHAGVFKCTEQGREAFLRFTASVK